MKWTTTRRETSLVEHACEHNVGHPNHGSALWIAEITAMRYVAGAGNEEELTPQQFDYLVKEHEQAHRLHGCDGCCGRGDFPGTYRDSLIHAHAMIRERNERLGHLHVEILNLEEDRDRASKRWWHFLRRWVPV